MSAINQSDAGRAEIEVDSLCIDGLTNESCAPVDGPLTEIAAS
jgi:hypothetical protein